MAIGLGTYAYFWRCSDEVPHPLELEAMIEETAELGGEVFQICFYPKLEGRTPAELERLRQRAESLGVVLELGTRGLETAHLMRYLELARALDARFVRTLFNSETLRPTFDEARELLQRVLPSYAENGVRIGLETYEQVPVQVLVDIVEQIDSPSLGICLDPANTVARLEMPRDVIDRTAAHVVNLHVKDFTFKRREGWVGFTLEGSPLGQGLLDYAYERAVVRPRERGINQIIEHWLPWLSNAEETRRAEAEWTRTSLEWLKSHS
jgi:3-oxoisoapionate decarboxylase